MLSAITRWYLQKFEMLLLVGAFGVTNIGSATAQPQMYDFEFFGRSYSPEELTRDLVIAYFEDKYCKVGNYPEALGPMEGSAALGKLKSTGEIREQGYFLFLYTGKTCARIHVIRAFEENNCVLSQADGAHLLDDSALAEVIADLGGQGAITDKIDGPGKARLLEYPCTDTARAAVKYDAFIAAFTAKNCRIPHSETERVFSEHGLTLKEAEQVATVIKFMTGHEIRDEGDVTRLDTVGGVEPRQCN